MSRACSVCSHPDHLDIDAALLGAGTERLSGRAVAQRWGLSRASVQRHAQAHIAPVLRAVTEQAGTLHAESMLQQLAGAYERIVRLADRAEAAGDLRTAVSAVREIRGTVETFARVGLAMAQHVEPEEDQRIDLDDRIDAALSRRMAGGAKGAIGSGDDDDVVEGVLVEE
jgi:hypothetical protein